MGDELHPFNNVQDETAAVITLLLPCRPKPGCRALQDLAISGEPRPLEDLQDDAAPM
jgi:hypothetical protein